MRDDDDDFHLAYTHLCRKCIRKAHCPSFTLPIRYLPPNKKRPRQVEKTENNLRMLINETRGIIDLIVDHQVQILLPRMRADLRISEFLRHRCL